MSLVQATGSAKLHREERSERQVYPLYPILGFRGVGLLGYRHRFRAFRGRLDKAVHDLA